jgi:hypothetical protein
MLQGLQFLGTLYVTAVLSETTGMNGTFALVLGLMGLLYIAAVMGVIGMEVNVVLARRLYPRALMTLFTDKVELTAADRRAYTYYVRAQRHKVNEVIDVHFTETDAAAVEPAPRLQELRQQPPTTVLRTSEVSEPDDARAEGERPAQDVPREHQP